MNFWAVNPVWQNFSSLFREAVAAADLRTGMERSHHLTGSLYFGIAALEAFLNQKMRAHLSATKSEKEIYDVLRKGEIKSKVKKWPTKLVGKPLALNTDTPALIECYNNLRANLTHPKTDGHDIYGDLESVDPYSVVDAIAEYVVRFHEAGGNAVSLLDSWVELLQSRPQLVRNFYQQRSAVLVLSPGAWVSGPSGSAWRGGVLARP